MGYNFTFFATPAFLDAEGAYRLRCAGPPDELHLDVTLGLNPNARVMWLLQSYNTISPWSSSPIFTAWSSYGVQLSIVYALDEHWSVQAGAFTTVATFETNSQHGLWRQSGGSSEGKEKPPPAVRLFDWDRRDAVAASGHGE